MENKLLYDQVQGAENSVQRLRALTDALRRQAALIAAENAKLASLKWSLQQSNSTAQRHES